MNEKKCVLYLECYSGISGDMVTAALLDLGASEEQLLAALDTLPVHGFKVRVSRVAESGLDACDFDVQLDGEHAAGDERAGRRVEQATVHVEAVRATSEGELGLKVGDLIGQLAHDVVRDVGRVRDEHGKRPHELGRDA